MSKYMTFKVLLPDDEIVEQLAKDSIQALELVADFYEVPYDALTLV